MFKNRGGPKESAGSNIDHQRLLALVNHLTDAVLALDSNLSIILANGAALNLLDKNELKNLPLNKAVELIDKTGNPVDPAALIQRSPHGYSSQDLRLRFQDGSMLNLFLNLAPVKLTYGTQNEGGYVLIMRDITREKLQEEERDDFINVAGHELRTPVAIVEGSVSNALLLAGKAGVSDTVTQALKTAHDQTIFLSSLINDLAVLSRADRGKLAMSIEAFSVADLMQELSSSYTAQARDKGLTLSFQTDPEASELTSSRLYVHEILQNFLTNAIKYTLNGGVAIEASKTESGVQFHVSDTGIGISQSDQNKLFTKFFRSGDERIKQINGTGLGLFITLKLAKLIGAQIDMKSELNKGTVFSISVPNIQPPKAQQTIAAESAH
ncbi:PAS domain-containing sensor histidine kinase [Candidatus Saccharibacteria bacterium]|nr:PAS domain-containing sensor histidine kinase [Candidatus Saccharibacteria bacterium]